MMETTSSFGEVSFLDKDDINGPGQEKYVKRTGDKSIDFALFKISQYSNSAELSDRIKFSKELEEILQQLGSRNSSSLNHVLQKYTEDFPEIRVELAQQLPSLYSIYINSFNSYKEASEVFMPLLEKLLNDKHQDVLKAACASSIKIAGLLTKDDTGSLLLTMILGILHDEEEETRIRALIVLKDLIAFLSPDICECFVFKEAMLLSSDNIVKVRKAVAECVPKLTKVVQSPVYFDKLMAVFTELSKDSIWGVRKACVECVLEMLESLDADAQQRFILPIFDELLNDKSNSVRQAALLQLGPCINSCKGKVPENMIAAYIDLSKNPANKGEFQYHCAYYFPAVLLKLGKDSWSTLKSAYVALITDSDGKSKKSLISSMHEIGSILQPELATIELLPLFERVFTESPGSKLIAISYLAKFLAVIEAESRLNFLKYIKSSYKVTANWRMRLIIAQQLSDIIDLFEFDLIVIELAPVILYLNEDKFAKIREAAAKGLGKLVNSVLKRIPNHEIIRTFKSMTGTASNTLKKQTFAMACEEIVANPEFVSHFGNEIKYLSEDKCPTVRICCAKTVRTAVELNKNDNFWTEFQEKMSHDFDADVRFEISRKYDVERGVFKLRPNSKTASDLMMPMFRAIFPDADVEELINFSCGANSQFHTLKETIKPSMNGFVEEILLKSVARAKMLIEC